MSDPKPRSKIYKCIRCLRSFVSRFNRKPVNCPKCGSSLWDVPRVRKPGGGRKKLVQMLVDSQSVRRMK
jgi:DNA-directed RNA polymerase subunit RPC12/RpoP